MGGVDGLALVCVFGVGLRYFEWSYFGLPLGENEAGLA